MNKEVEIEVSYVGDQPLISILESNLDLEKVSFRRNQYAVRSVLPINLILSTTAIYLFEKLVLDPILDPLAEKFNWVEASKKLLKPHQSFNIKIQLNGDDFIIAPLHTDHDLIAHIWHYIRQSIDITRSEGIFDEISQIRITSLSPGNPQIILYRGSKPWRLIDLKEKQSLLIDS